MAARVNIKLVIILVLVVFTTAGVAGGLYVYQLRKDASRNERIGDEALAMGDLPKARDHYGRAVHKEPGNRVYLQKYEDVLLQLVPRTADRANELYQQRLSVLRHGAQHHPLDADEHLQLIEELHRVARVTQFEFYFELLESAANNMFDRVHIDDPKRDDARMYRAIAQFNRPAIYSPDDLTSAVQDMEIYLEKHPENGLAWSSLVRGQLSMAEQLLVSAQPRRAEEFIADARSTLRRATEAAPDGIELAKVRLLDVLRRRDANSDAASEDDIIAAVDDLLAQINKDSPAWSVAEVLNVLRNARSDELRDRTISTLEDYLSHHEKNPLLRLLVSRLLFEWGQYDEAERNARVLLDAEPLPVDILAWLQFDLKKSAAGVLSDIAYQRWVDAETNEQRQKYVAEMEEARDLVSRLVAGDVNNSILLRADGKVAFVKGDYVRSAAKFEQLLKLSQSQSRSQYIENYAFAIHSHEELGNVGMAHERVVEALELRNNEYVPLELKKADLELKMRRYNDAKITATKILERHPDQEAAKRVVQIADAGGEIGEIESGDPVINAVNQAQTAWSNDDRDEARAILEAALADHGENIDLLTMLARLELIVGNNSEAVAYADRGLMINANSNLLQQIKAQAENPNRVDALRELARMTNPDDPVEASAAMIIGLRTIVDLQERRLATLEQQGRNDEAADARAEIAQAEQALVQAIAAVEQGNPDHAVLIDYMLNEAVTRKDWTTAQQYVERAARLNLDGANGDLYRARLHMVRGDYGAAVRILQAVTTRMDYSTKAWQNLGYAYEQLGRFADATRAYEQAYRGNPTRLDVIRSYTTVLVQIGELSRALDVMRQAKNLAPDDPTMRNTRLELEATVGDPVVALRERRELYAKEPDNRNNAIRLAALLGRLEPARSTILNDRGEPRFNDRQWLQLSVVDRQSVIDRTRQAWQAEADQIVTALAAAGEKSVELAALKAELLRARGNVAAGEVVLRDFIQQTPADERDAGMYVVLGRYLVDANRQSEAIAAFREGLEYQDDDNRIVDSSLGDLYFHMNQREEALTHFRRVLETGDNPAVRLRTIECLIDLDRLDEAQQMLDELVQESGADFSSWMLTSAILEREGDRLREQGNQLEANFKYDEFRNAIDNAQALRPRDVLPKLRLARHQLRAFQHDGKRQHLDEALRTLGAADQISANDVRVSLVRVDVLGAMGDVRGAISELRRLLDVNPSESRARSLLVSLLIDQGDVSGAIDVVQNGISNNETIPQWHVQLGDIYLNYQRDPAAAVQPYMTALSLHPTADLLAKAAQTRLMANHPPRDVIDFIQRYPQFQRSSPNVLSMLARALAMADQPQAIELILREMYGRLTDLIGQGVLDPTSVNAWFRVASEGAGAYGPAKVEALLMELTSQNPSGFELSSLSFLYRKHSADPSHRSRALQLQRQALGAVSDAPPTVQSPYYYDLGTMLVENGELQEAAEMFRESFRMNPNHALAYNNYAYLLAEHLGQPQQAIEPARKAAELQPDDPSILDTLGWIQFRLGNLEEAEQAIRRSLEQNPGSPDVMLHLAEVLIARGELDKAMNGPLRQLGESRPSEALQAEIDRLVADIRTRREQQQ